MACVSDPRTNPRPPRLLIFDVNGTLSDMAPMATRFTDVGASAELATSWFAELLRDGFALTVVRSSEKFADLAAESLRVSLQGVGLNRPPEEAVAHILEGFSTLTVHGDVPEGMAALSELGIRLVTLSNGATSVAEALLDRAGVSEHLERLLSVEDAGGWKPDARAYAYALQECEVAPADAMLVAIHPWDVDGASRAGLATAWLDRTGGRYPTYFRPADVRASSLVDLAAQLR